MEDERICMLALGNIFGYEPAMGLTLLRHFGSAREVFKAGERDLRGLLPAEFAARVCTAEVEKAEKILSGIQASGTRFLTLDEEGYPPLLRECPDPPLGLYYKGDSPPEETFGGGPAIAIVGTRDISSYGKEWCSQIVKALSRCPRKPLIVSGLAIGVDYEAHSTALECGLPTVAVMATGTDSVYPFRHGLLARTIASTPGCALITDYPPGTAPQALNFLRRNRIIAGMCTATILIESKIKGGGMNTARLAFGYDRDVFSLPGRIDDLRSQGCNLLIRDRVAEALTDIPDLVSKLGLGASKRVKAKDLLSLVRNTYADTMPPEEVEIMVGIASAIKTQRDITLEELAELVGMSYTEVATAAGILESDGIIEIGLLRNCSINVRYC